ncbi:beta-lactamase [Vibrio coralliilyticus]|uniref:class C beta-lactamase n=1 Tax=Vibrio coralliilyticus TaxID=190893 RepID=UPI0015609BA5|nr:class C beta-lactamase [Vibrio coralliilyticus]NRF27104.1 beta-lactamase [Vibrio coralliilyticus]NRF81356.1 beta-lactamase [Vibrio coralliilyticus]
MKHSLKLVTLLSVAALSSNVYAGETLKSKVDEQAHTLMDKHNIPGMSFAVIIDGKAHIYNYGYADLEKKLPVTDDTIFELGSISKTISSTMISYAVQTKALSMSDKVEKYIPELRGTTIGQTDIETIANYTAGGLPLQFPNGVTNYEQMIAYYKNWKQEFTPKTSRLYSNVSIGLSGHIAAVSLENDYSRLAEEKIFPSLNMANSYIDVPKNKVTNYAYGYNAKGEAIRVSPGMLDAEAYGVKSTTTDLAKFIQANMGLSDIDPTMQKALNATRKGYYDASSFTQGLGWEMYSYPFSLNMLLEGNSTDTIINPKSISKSEFEGKVMDDAWVNKTGSTNGFGGYIAYVPSEKAGIVILANKYYPNNERIEAAYKILKSAI